MVKISGKILADQNQVIEIYRDLLISRLGEEEIQRLYLQKLINGFCHLYIGQEAVAAGIKHATNRDVDTIITSYRCHGFLFMLSRNIKPVMLELLGRAGGCSKGKGGSMHMFDLENNFYGGHGIVGAQISIGTGLAFANKYKKLGGVSITLLGDGASNQGQFYESMNIAKLWKLPVLYIIENNRYAMGTSIQRSSASTKLYRRGDSFEIPGFKVDGMNPLKVHSAVSELCSKIRKQNQPIILEVETYRYKGHSMSDPGKYRDREEIDEMRKKYDPITNIEKYIIDNKFLTKDEINNIRTEIKKDIEEISKDCISSEYPNIEETYRDIYDN